jgi:two-component system LytT family response regulator
MKPLTCILVDDEPLARRQLRALLEAGGQVEILAEAGGVDAGIEAARRLRPELLFLDIQMRGRDGFEVLAALPEPPAVIFVTAHDAHAVRAFEVNAVDYLLKPVDEARLARALARVRDRSGEAPEGGALGEEDTALLPLGASGHFVAVGDILFIEADGHHCRVGLADGGIRMVRQSFRSWGDRLPAAMFEQLERGLIINRRRIRSFEHGVTGGRLTLEGAAAPLDLGASAAKRLEDLLAGG